MLNVNEHGQPGRPTLLIAHGLFGSGRNWGAIGKRLSDAFHVRAPDMRNHGDSPWFDTQSYAEMADDLAELLDGPADVVGHSMGGKAAMMLALTRPDLVRRLVVADIAPVAYTHSQAHNIAAMRAVDLSGITRRAQAAAQLDVDAAVKPFLLQSLDTGARFARIPGAGHWLHAEKPQEVEKTLRVFLD
jgi:pimeloyl-ACP methyl ester carboxylesterase